MEETKNAFYAIQPKSEALVCTIKTDLILLIREALGLEPAKKEVLCREHIHAIESGDLEMIKIEDLAKALELLDVEVSANFHLVDATDRRWDTVATARSWDTVAKEVRQEILAGESIPLKDLLDAWLFKRESEAIFRAEIQKDEILEMDRQ